MSKPTKRNTVKRKAAKPIDRLRIDFHKDRTGVHVHASGTGIEQFNLGPLFLVLQWVSQHQHTAVALLEAYEQGKLALLRQPCECADCVRAREVVVDSHTVQ